MKKIHLINGHLSLHLFIYLSVCLSVCLSSLAIWICFKSEPFDLNHTEWNKNLVKQKKLKKNLIN